MTSDPPRPAAPPSLRPPHIRRYLDASTAHLPPDLREELNGVDGVVAEEHRHGWWLWVPDDPEASEAEQDTPLPPAIRHLQDYARRLDCDWIRVDSDAEIDPALATYDDESEGR